MACSGSCTHILTCRHAHLHTITNNIRKSSFKYVLVYGQSGSGDKDACWHSKQPEFAPENPHGGRRESTPTRCSVTSTHVKHFQIYPFTQNYCLNLRTWKINLEDMTEEKAKHFRKLLHEKQHGNSLHYFSWGRDERMSIPTEQSKDSIHVHLGELMHLWGLLTGRWMRSYWQSLGDPKTAPSPPSPAHRV